MFLLGLAVVWRVFDSRYCHPVVEKSSAAHCSLNDLLDGAQVGETVSSRLVLRLASPRRWSCALTLFLWFSYLVAGRKGSKTVRPGPGQHDSRTPWTHHPIEVLLLCSVATGNDRFQPGS